MSTTPASPPVPSAAADGPHERNRPRRWGRIAAAAALIGLAAAGTAVAAAPEPGTPPPAPAQVAALDTWEYRWALARPRGEDLGELAEFGAEGWDVVGPVSEGTGGYWTFLMKRPLPPAPSTPAP